MVTNQQKNTVFDFNGKVCGEIMNPNYVGGTVGFPSNIENKIIVKNIQIFDNALSNINVALANMVMIKGPNGATIVPYVTPGVVGQLNEKNRFFVTVGLTHNEPYSNEIWLFADLKANRSGASSTRCMLCHWTDEAFTYADKAWEINIMSTTIGILDSAITLKLGLALSENSQVYSIRIDIDGWNNQTRSTNVSVNVDLEVTDVTGKTGLENLIRAVSEAFQLKIDDYMWDVANYVKLEDNETAMKDLEDYVNALGMKIDQVSVTANSKFVSR